MPGRCAMCFGRLCDVVARRYTGRIEKMKNALQIGKAGEHLVCADLLMNGYEAYLSDQGLVYDIVLDSNEKLYRVQVKATLKPRELNCQGRKSRIGYSYSARIRGKNGDARLKNTECDIVAFVALDIKRVAYFLVDFTPTTVSLSPSDFDGYGVDLVFERSQWIARNKSIEETNKYDLSARSIARSGIGGKLNENQVKFIKQRLLCGDRSVDIAEDFKVSEQTIAGIKKGRSWKHVRI